MGRDEMFDVRRSIYNFEHGKWKIHSRPIIPLRYSIRIIFPAATRSPAFIR